MLGRMAYTSKKEARQAVLAKLKGMSADVRREKSARLRAKAAPYLARVSKVCLYAPMPHEVDLMPLLQEYPDKRFFFPRCIEERGLSFHHVSDPAAQMTVGAYGISTPLQELPQLPPSEAELIIVPGVAFTRDGRRLGYGGGYYDRYLPRCPQAATLALAFAEQMLNDLPTDHLDCTIDHIVME